MAKLKEPEWVRLNRVWADVASAAASARPRNPDTRSWPWEIRLYGGPADGMRARYAGLREMRRAHSGHWLWVPTGFVDAIGRPVYHQYGTWGCWGDGVHVSAYRYIRTVGRARPAALAVWKGEGA